MTIWRMRISRRLRKVTKTKTKTNTHIYNYVIPLLYHGTNDYKNAPECYVIRTLPVLLIFITAV